MVKSYGVSVTIFLGLSFFCLPLYLFKQNLKRLNLFHILIVNLGFFYGLSTIGDYLTNGIEESSISSVLYCYMELFCILLGIYFISTSFFQKHDNFLGLEMFIDRLKRVPIVFFVVALMFMILDRVLGYMVNGQLFMGEFSGGPKMITFFFLPLTFFSLFGFSLNSFKSDVIKSTLSKIAIAVIFLLALTYGRRLMFYCFFNYLLISYFMGNKISILKLAASIFLFLLGATFYQSNRGKVVDVSSLDNVSNVYDEYDIKNSAENLSVRMSSFRYYDWVFRLQAGSSIPLMGMGKVFCNSLYTATPSIFLEQKNDINEDTVSAEILHIRDKDYPTGLVTSLKIDFGIFSPFLCIFVFFVLSLLLNIFLKILSHYPLFFSLYFSILLGYCFSIEGGYLLLLVTVRNFLIFLFFYSIASAISSKSFRSLWS